jgi:uncharacterized protein YhfF
MLGTVKVTDLQSTPVNGLRERSNATTTKRDLSVALDGSGDPVLVIKTINVVILPFNEVSEQFAFEEGEGDRSIGIGGCLTRTAFGVIASRIGRSMTRC